MSTAKQPVISETALLATLNWRYATKHFDTSKKIPPATLATLLEALRLSPSSFGLSFWKAIVVENPEVRAQLKPVSWDQPQITEASHLIVLATKTNLGESDVAALIKRISEVRSIPTDSLTPYRNVMNDTLVARHAVLDTWTVKQTYIALGNLLTSAALLGIDACPIEGFDPASYNKILNLPAQNLTASVVAAVGYRAADDKYASLAKVRFPINELVVKV